MGHVPVPLVRILDSGAATPGGESWILRALDLFLVLVALGSVLAVAGRWVARRSEQHPAGKDVQIEASRQQAETVREVQLNRRMMNGIVLVAAGLVGIRALELADRFHFTDDWPYQLGIVFTGVAWGCFVLGFVWLLAAGMRKAREERSARK